MAQVTTTRMAARARSFCTALVGALALVAPVMFASPAADAQERPIKWSLVKPPPQATEGKPFTLRLRATIPDGWHLYSTTQPPGGPRPTVISLPGGSAFVMSGSVRAPDPDVAFDPNFNIPTETYVDSVTFPLRLTARAAGTKTLAVAVSFQTCTDRYCLPPTDETIEVPVVVVAAPPGTSATIPRANPPLAESNVPPLDSAIGGTGTTTRAGTAAGGGADSASASAAPAIPPAISQQPYSNTGNQSLSLFLWLAAVMGALSLLTPCVFPMIPITVSYFARNSETTRRTPAKNALIYAAGIMATFTVLGMGIALLVGAGGINRFAANPWVNLLVTVIFIAFALNLFGVWQFTIPSSVLTRLTAASSGSRSGETAGILTMGLTFTLTSFTCTAPFVGTLLVMAAAGDWQWPLLGLLVFSGVFALPFFLLAMMPSAVAKLPRSGQWMQTVKVLLGFVEVATAMKFLANADLVWQWGIFTRNMVLAVWMTTAVAAAAYLLGLFQRGTTRHPAARTRQIAAVCCVAGAIVLGRGLTGVRLGELESFLPPPEGAVTEGTAAVAGELSWMVNDYPAGLARAKAEGKALLIDFTGYTCTNCRWMEANMFPREEISRELEQFIRVRLYTDGQGELYRAQQQMELDKFGTVALPFYAIVDAEGTTRSQFLGMTRSSDEYLAFLRATAPLPASASGLLRQ